jgi:copper chaperone
MASQQFSVQGLHCQGCAKTVTDALMKLSAVTSVDVDLDMTSTSTVRVDAESPLSAADVQATLDSEGNFTVVA